MDANTPQLLAQLAAQMSTTVEHLWGVLIQQAFINGVVYSIMFVALVTASVLSIRWCMKQHAVRTYSEEARIVVYVLAGIVTFFTFIFVTVEVPNIITAFLNPEYWALQKVLAVGK